MKRLIGLNEAREMGVPAGTYEVWENKNKKKGVRNG